MNSKFSFILILILFGLFLQSKAQNNVDLKEGTVSYISGESIYVKFESTTGIENGDTLFVLNDAILESVLLVVHHSSISCMCKRIGERTIKVSDRIIVSQKRELVKEDLSVQNEIQVEQDLNEQALATAPVKLSKTKERQNVKGQLRLSSYSNFSNSISDDYHRFRYTFSLNALNISNSKLSAETYITFSHKLNEWDVVQENLNNALKIYSLALKYDFNKSTALWVGRKINPQIANIGAVDGLQFQKQWNGFYVGAVAGTRPDFLDYGYNSKLFEYGAYIGQSHKIANGFVQSSLAFFEQRNSSNIDRRFLYFQHSNSYIKNLNIFSSFELDLYKLENGEPTNSFSLTSLYLSIRYRFSRSLSLFTSYDNRKNVIYYETFKNYADAILQEVSRQGFRFRINYRPINYLNLGVNAGTRFRKTDPRPTKTMNGFASYSQIPFVKASFTLSANVVQTSYLDGQILGGRLSKDMLKGKLSTMLSYRRAKFDYVSSNSQIKQNIAELDLSYQFNKKLYFIINFESTLEKEVNYNRVYLNLRKKF